MENIIKFLTIIWFIIWQQEGFFRATENYYCRKNKGNCYNCKAWSCLKGYYNTNKK